ncbi:hypothetical protein FACS18949_00410 [Clostridia bacterium]|nr:hypothetical protein FACS189425_00580 [Clostridia bacterium]GHV31590.1 hypothetical protein FACS18949_00410 [Clostridia bacterium]
MKRLFCLVIAVAMMTGASALAYYSAPSSDGSVVWSSEPSSGFLPSGGMFYDGLAAVTTTAEGGTVGLMDYIGRMVVPFGKYKTINRFADGFAVVTDDKYNYAVINRRGVEVVPFGTYNTINYVSDGMVVVSDRALRYALYTLGGARITGYGEYSAVNGFHNGYAVVRRAEGGYALLDKLGATVLAAGTYDYIHDFSDGMAVVLKGGKYGAINTKLELAVPLAYEELNPFADGKAVATNFSYEQGVIDKANAVVTAFGKYTPPKPYEHYTLSQVNDFNGGYAFAQATDGKWGVLALRGYVLPGTNPSDWAKDHVAEISPLIPNYLKSDYLDAATRAEFAAMLVPLLERELGAIIPSPESAAKDTSDVNILKLHAAGLMSGDGGSVFTPNRVLTRQEAAVLLAKAAKKFGLTAEPKALIINDENRIASWAKTSVRSVYNLGVMSGVGGDNFAPLEVYTREACLVTINKLSKLTTIKG